MDRVELIVQLTGDKEAVSSLQNIKRAADTLKNQKVQLQVDKLDVDRQINDLKNRIALLTKSANRIKLDGGDATTVLNYVAELKRELGHLQGLKTEIGFDARGVSIALGDVKNLNKELDNTRTKAQTASQALTEIGGALKSIGAFSTSLGGIFDSNIIDTMERYITVMGTRMFAQNWGQATERFDILSTYADYLDVVGVSAEEADKSLTKINSKIQGIPVGLSDVAYQTRMYQMYLDDMERATNLAIGLNRALIAGGANEQMRNTASYEIDRLLATGELNTKRQWRALIQGLGVSARVLREELGFGDITQNEFIEMLYGGAISGDEFIRGIEKLADADKLNSLLDIYRTTIESGLSNIRFALTRGKANILDALDESLTEGTGRNISGWLLELRDGINEVYGAISGYISENPEILTGGIERILEVVDRLGAFNWEGLADGVANGLGRYVDIMLGLYDAIPEGMFQDLITYSLVWAGPVGTALTALGNALIFVGKSIEWVRGESLLAGWLRNVASGLGNLIAMHPGILAVTAALASLILIARGIQDDSIGSISERLGLDDLISHDQELQQTARLLADVNKEVSSFNSDPQSGLDSILSLKASTVTQLEQARAKVADIRAEIARLNQLQEDARNASPDEIDFMQGTPDYSAEIDTYSRALADEIKVVQELEQAKDDLTEKEKRYREELENPLPRRMTVGDPEAQAEALEEEARQAKEAVDELAKAYKELYEAHNKALTSQLGGFDELKKQEATSFASIEKNVEARRAAAESYEKNLDKVAVFAALNPQYRGGLNALLNDIAAGGYNNAQELQEIVKVIEAAEQGDEKAVDRLEEIGRDKAELLERIARISRTQTFMDLTEERGTEGALEYMLQIGVTLDEVPQEVLDQLAAEYLAEQERIRQEVEQRVKGERENSAYRSTTGDEGVPMAREHENSAYWSREADIEGAVAAAAEGYDAIKAAINDYIKSDEGLLDDESKEQIGKTWEEVYNALLEGQESFAEALSGDDDTSLTSGLTTANDMMAALAGEVIPPFADAILLLGESIMSVTNDGIVPMTTATQDLTQAILELIEALERLFNLIQSKLGVLQQFIAHLRETAVAAREATQAVQELAAAIDALHDKTVTITVNVVGGEGLEGLGGGATGATGGLITGPGPAKYYASGGLLGNIFKPRGTDTIPAMLTPGEYVLRRGAVDQLGVPFLQRLNRLDIAGALDNLMHRFYRPSSAAYSVVNNSADNRAYNVNVYNYRSSEDYTYRVAAHFAHAL